MKHNKDHPLYDIYGVHIETLVDLQRTSDMLGLEIEVFKLREVYYNLHRANHGSGKVYNNPQYQNFMNERYIFIEDTINCIIEAKLKYEKNET
jgi:hypothetical protein